jgi:glycosyltransferase involved in cell wall biosynthesis
MSYIAILLSTYNSEKYLKQQLDSLFNQSYTHWQLLVRDDGSTDSTLSILKSYNDPRIKIVEVGPNLGTIQSFSKLLELGLFDYFFFCDHDDIWKPDKIERQIIQIQSIEHEKGKDIPILVHSDLEVINELGETIATSMWSFGKFYTYRKTLPQLIVQGFVTGCTIAGNQALLKMIRPIPKGVFMHDWWSSLVAATIGVIYSDPITSIRYRVHSQNQIGVIKPSIFQIFDKIKNPEKYVKFFYESFSQAEAFLNRFGNQLKPKDRRALEIYGQLLHKNRFIRIFLAIRYGFIRSTLYRNGLFYWVLFFVKKHKTSSQRG